MPRLILALIVCALLSGCQNPWKDFYQGMTLPADAPDNGLPDCRQVSDFDASIKEYMRENYFPMGQSVFNAGNNVGTGDMQKFGATIKADVILYAVGNRTTTQSAMAVPQYNPGTQQTTYLNGYGSNGSSFYGTANTYSSGTYSTTVVPVTIVRQDYYAVYLKKNWNKPILGIAREPVTAEQAKVVGTNNALLVTIVARRTPAFYADIYEGDCILEFNGRRVPLDDEEFSALLDKHRGQEIELLIYRNGSKVKKKIRLATGA
jgi:S1-C subfamily serine protease